MVWLRREQGCAFCPLGTAWIGAAQNSSSEAWVRGVWGQHYNMRGNTPVPDRMLQTEGQSVQAPVQFTHLHDCSLKVLVPKRLVQGEAEV